jgi:hypothetical protein
MKLGTMLLRDGVLTLDQLEAALRQQVLFGGKLGTNLVELGLLNLDQLTGYLSRTLGVPPAAKEHFDAAQPEAVQVVPAHLAEQHIAFPLELREGVLVVALAEPRDKKALAALTEVSGRQLEARVAPELRILFYLERHYGVRRKARWVRVSSPPAPGSEERRRTLDEEGPGKVSIEPRRGTAPPVVHAADASGPATPRPIGLADTLARLEEAATRDVIIESLLRFARGRLETSVMFLLKDGMAVGWRGFTSRAGDAEIAALALPLDVPSCLSTAYADKVPWRGKPASTGVDARLTAGLRGEGAPAEAMVVPIVIGPRVVNLMYLHGEGGRPLDAGAIDGILSVTDAASEAYARIIQKAKGRG